MTDITNLSELLRLTRLPIIGDICCLLTENLPHSGFSNNEIIESYNMDPKLGQTLKLLYIEKKLKVRWRID